MHDSGMTLPRRAAAGATASAFSSRTPGILQKFRAPLVSVVLITADVVAVLLAGVVADTIGGSWAGEHGDLFATALLFVALGCCSGLYTVPSPSLVERFRLRAIVSTAAVGLQLLISDRASGTSAAFLLTIFQISLLVPFGYYLETAVRAALMRTGLWGAATVVFNRDEKSQRVVELLLAHPEIGLRPIGFVAERSQIEHDGGRTTGPAPTIFDPTAELDGIDARVAVFSDTDEMIRAVSRAAPDAALPRLLLIEDKGSVDGERTGLRPCMIGDAAGFEVSPVWGGSARERFKRTIDLCATLPLSLIALPVVATLAGLIALVSPGSPFYWQERVGRYGKPIRVLKLRTMHADAERRLGTYLEQNPNARAEWDRFFKLKHDPRILPFVGNFIRRSSLDELPQIWNILNGDMSLVGPRPFPAYHVRAFDPDFQILRASVKPGLTGLWQVSSRSNGDLGVQKAQDSFYIKNWSISLDFYILLQTLPAVLSGEGAR